ncbi:hypothetical protein [Streptomyces pseudogriseolus]|uniref:hypothetical protein n=1 Tax=Streptomyces pseudogriseolus TaxID=36817 RepID=UPI003FA20BFA
MFRHYDGTAWTKQDGAAAPDGDTRWPSCTFHGVAQADDAGSFWTVGSAARRWTHAATRTYVA